MKTSLPRNRDRILKNFNKHLMEIFFEISNEKGKKTAIEFKNEKIDFNTLNKRSNQIANYFLKNNVNESDIVAICVNRSTELISWIFGIFKIGAIYVPLTSKYPKQRIMKILEEVDCKFVVISSSCEKLFDKFTGKVFISDKLHSDIFSRESFESYSLPNSLNSERTVAIFFTSGSTGSPKGVKVSSKNVVAHSLCRFSYLCLNESDKYASFGTITVLFSLCEFLIPLLNGIPLVIVPEEIRSDPEEIMKYINEHRATAFVLTSVILKHLPKKDFAHQLKVVGVGAESCDYETMKFWSSRVPLFNTYGLTESTCAVTMKKWDPSDENSNVGKPFGTTKLYIMDSEMKPIDKQGVVGEVYIEGLEVTQGYYFRKENSSMERFEKGRFLSNPYYDLNDSTSSKLILRTGDFCKYNEKGEILFVGRKDHQKKIRGYRINLLEIERMFRKMKNLIKDIVVEVKENLGRKKLVAYIIMHEQQNQKETEDTIRKNIINNLPDYMIPNNFVYLKEFPKTVSCKIDRKKLVENTPIKDEFESVFTCKNIFDVLNNTKKADSISYSNKSFREMGGCSISAINIVNQLRLMGKRVSFDDLMNKKFVEMVKCVKNVQTGKESGHPNVEKEDFELEKIVKKYKSKFGVKKRRKNVEIKSIFLTGSTGFVGSHILEQMISQFGVGVKIICLVRNENEIVKCKNVQQLEGDLSLPRFGLSIDQFLKLSENTDLIVHCGALVNHFVDYNSHYETNVRSLYDIVELSRCSTPIVFISTLSVFTKSTRGESRKIGNIFDQIHDVNIGYHASKWVCDYLLSKHCMEFVRIVRIPLVCVSTGDFGIIANEKDWLNRIIKGILKFRVAPLNGVENSFNMIPVDILADFVVSEFCLSFTPGATNCWKKNVNFGIIVKFIERFLMEKSLQIKKYDFVKWVNVLNEKCTGLKEFEPMMMFLERMKNSGKIGSEIPLYGDKEFDKCSKMRYIDLKKLLQNFWKTLIK